MSGIILDGKQYDSGNLYVPDDLEAIEIQTEHLFFLRACDMINTCYTIENLKTVFRKEKLCG